MDGELRMKWNPGAWNTTDTTAPERPRSFAKRTRLRKTEVSCDSATRKRILTPVCKPPEPSVRKQARTTVNNPARTRIHDKRETMNKADSEGRSSVDQEVTQRVVQKRRDTNPKLCLHKAIERKKTYATPTKVRNTKKSADINVTESAFLGVCTRDGPFHCRKAPCKYLDVVRLRSDGTAQVCVYGTRTSSTYVTLHVSRVSALPTLWLMLSLSIVVRQLPENRSRVTPRHNFFATNVSVPCDEEKRVCHQL